jgi:hypothetical protein
MGRLTARPGTTAMTTADIDRSQPARIPAPNQDRRLPGDVAGATTARPIRRRTGARIPPGAEPARCTRQPSEERSMRFPILPTALMALALAPAAGAEVPPSPRILLTDPVQLDQLGYPPDASNIHLHPALLQPADGARAEAIAGAAAGQLHWTTVAGFALQPQSDTTEYAKGPSVLAVNGGVFSLTPGGLFEGQVQMAQTARVQFVDIFGLHNQPGQTLGVSLVERCLPFLGGGNPVETVLTVIDVANQGGNFRATAPFVGEWTDGRTCTLHVRARFGSTGAAAPGVNMQLAKVRVEWQPDRIFADEFEP